MSRQTRLRLPVRRPDRNSRGRVFAAVEATQWDEDRRHSIDSTILAWEECASRDEAEVAARRLLTENAKHFRHRVSIEPNIYLEVEWENLDRR